MGSVELAYWTSIAQSQDPRDFDEYLVKYPDGAFAGLARRRLESLRPTAAPRPASQPAARGTTRLVAVDLQRVARESRLGQGYQAEVAALGQRDPAAAQARGAELTTEFQTKLRPMLEQLMRDRGLGLILDSQAVLAVGSRFDVSADVVELASDRAARVATDPGAPVVAAVDGTPVSDPVRLRLLADQLARARGLDIVVSAAFTVVGNSAYDLSADLAALAAGRTLSPAPALAAPALAVVDVARVSAESRLGKFYAGKLDELKKEIEQASQRKQAELASKDAEIARLADDVQKASVPSPEAAPGKTSALEAKKRERESFVQDGQAEIKRLQERAQVQAQGLNTEFQARLKPLLQELLRERGIDLLFDRQSVFGSGQSIDLTAAAIARLEAAARP
jgi:Skp family chaperone for outer membrane proteins